MMFEDYIIEGEIFVCNRPPAGGGYGKIIKVVDDIVIYEYFAVPAMWGPWHNTKPDGAKAILYYSLGEKGITRKGFSEWIESNKAIPLSLAKRMVEVMEPNYPEKLWEEQRESLMNFQRQCGGDCNVPVEMKPGTYRLEVR